jgi:uncharacterized protein YidB (DUF937 family)
MAMEATMTATSTATMGIVDQITAGIEELIGSPTQGKWMSSTRTALMSMVIGMLEDGRLGLKSLITKFHENGMQNQAQSWCSTAQNEKISSEQVEKALGRDVVEQFAQEAGLPVSEVVHELAIVIPAVIDRFTPNGEIPEPGCVQQAASLLRTKLVM